MVVVNDLRTLRGNRIFKAIDHCVQTRKTKQEEIKKMSKEIITLIKEINANKPNLLKACRADFQFRKQLEKLNQLKQEEKITRAKMVKNILMKHKKQRELKELRKSVV